MTRQEATYYAAVVEVEDCRLEARRSTQSDRWSILVQREGRLPLRFVKVDSFRAYFAETDAIRGGA